MDLNVEPKVSGSKEWSQQRGVKTKAVDSTAVVSSGFRLRGYTL
jgi:hypothetical protein